MQGYIKLYREILGQPSSSNCSLLGFRCYLLLKANHAERIFFLGAKKITLKPGQLVTSQKKLSTHFNVSISTIHRRLKMLADEHLIKTQGYPKYTLVTMLLRDKYQGGEKLMESGGNAGGMPAETNKNEKNDINEEELFVSALIQHLRSVADKMDIAYNPQSELVFADKLINGDTFIRFCEKQNKSSIDMAITIMKKSVITNYWKGPCAGPKAIYENYADVFNQSKQHIGDEIDEFIMEQGDLTPRLLTIKKERTKKYPYKKPFVNIPHVQTFVDALKQGVL